MILRYIVEHMTCNITNPNMVKKAFINNNIFSGYLHSKGVVQHSHLGLRDKQQIVFLTGPINHS